MIYQVYGVSFSTTVRFPELVPGRPDEPALHFQLRRSAFQVDRSWTRLPPRVDSGGAPWLTVFARGGDLALRFADGGDFMLFGDGRRAVGYAAGASSSTIRHLFIDQALPLMLAHRGRLVLHASAVDCRGAVVFLGATGAGKSTLATSFGRADAPVLADDASVVEARAGRLWVHPAYAGVRMWPDALAQFGGSRGAPRVADFTVKRRLGPDDGRLTFADEPRALRRFYVLDPSNAVDEDEPRIGSLTCREGAMEFVKHSYVCDTTDRAGLARHFNLLVRDLAPAPVRRITYRRDLRAVGRLREAILADLAES